MPALYSTVQDVLHHFSGWTLSDSLTEIGPVTNEGEAVKGAPHFIRSMPNSKKDYDGIEPCAVGSTVEVLVSATVKSLSYFI